MEQSNVVPKEGDSKGYKNKSNLQKGKADDFQSNNANPFLISPYSPVNLGAFARNNLVNDISSIVSSIVGAV
jgi:hypothetical protein